MLAKVDRQKFQYASHLTFGINIMYVLVAGPLWWKLHRDKEEKDKIKAYVKGVCQEVKTELELETVMESGELSICLDNDHVIDDVGDTEKTVVCDTTTVGEVTVTGVESVQLVSLKSIVKTEENETGKQHDHVNEQSPGITETKNHVSNTQSEKKSAKLNHVVAIGTFTAKRDIQMSFEKGDLIGILCSDLTQRSAAKGWIKGILLKSSKYPITGKMLYIPGNFVEPR